MKTFIIILTALFSYCVLGQVPSYLSEKSDLYKTDPHQANLEWFKEAGFGMFIHYGLYSQLGKGEWVQFKDTIPLDEYTKLKDSFTAEGFDADFIARLAKKADMKYITITSKHHDGFCLFQTRQTDYNSLNSPAKRDLIGELAEACEKEGLGLFLYYSYAADWHHPYFYPRSKGWRAARPAYETPPEQYKYKRPEDFRKYIDYAHAQLKELLTQYPTIAGIWFDPIMGYYANPDFFPIEETYSLIRSLSPHALISFKQGANGDEDFVAPERSGKKGAHSRFNQFEVAKAAIEMNKEKPKEVCNTLQEHGKGSAWGYNSKLKHLGVDDVKIMLGDAFLNDYNLLLNIGPLPDGSVHPDDIKTLSNLR